jgi:sporulation protein YlmC with PRC-barrel domain
MVAGLPILGAMKLNHKFLTAALFVCGLALTAGAQSDPTPTPLGAEKTPINFLHVEIKNLQDQTLGRIKDLGVDLVNGRIVEVLVESDSSLEVGNKIVAVPPSALKSDPAGKVYRLDASRELFKTAEAIDLTKWVDAGRSDRVAAAYYLFGREPYFLEEGEVANRKAARPKVALGYVERSSKLIEMPVGNYQDEPFGKVWSLTLDIPRGRILSVIVLAPGNFETKSVIPAMALSFNAARDALLLDDTKSEYAEEPRYVFTEAAFGNKATSQEEAFKGKRTVALAQGDSYPDIDRTLLIYQNIRLAKIYQRNVQIGTLDGRVTLRGWVRSADDQHRIGEIAIAASRLELVDNQITVGRPVAGL